MWNYGDDSMKEVFKRSIVPRYELHVYLHICANSKLQIDDSKSFTNGKANIQRVLYTPWFRHYMALSEGNPPVSDAFSLINASNAELSFNS